jgi:hypothetical protein
VRVYAKEQPAKLDKSAIQLRTLANLGLSLVLGVTLLWGGCLSCSQYFMFPSSRAGCCNPAGHCGTTPQSPDSKDCHIQPIALTKTFAGVSGQPEFHAVTYSLVHAADGPANIINAQSLSFVVPEASPPDLCLLHSVIRI